MTVRLAASILCTALMCAPALAQQGTAPPSGNLGGSTAPPADFGNGGRPESHGGNVQIPGAAAEPSVASRNLSTEARQALGQIARIVATAQQYGNLASMRQTTGAMHDLGDHMVLTNSRIDRALVAIDPAFKSKDQIPPEQQARLDELARHVDDTQFAASVAQWVVQAYPHAISAMERIAQTPPFGEVAASALPELKDQLSAAQTILKTAGTTGGQPAQTGTLNGSDQKKAD